MASNIEPPNIELSEADKLDILAAAKMLADAKQATKHMAEVANDLRNIGINGIPLFVGLLATVAQQANVMLSDISDEEEKAKEKRIYLASQLATRTITVADSIMSMVGQLPTNESQNG